MAAARESGPPDSANHNEATSSSSNNNNNSNSNSNKEAASSSSSNNNNIQVLSASSTYIDEGDGDGAATTTASRRSCDAAPPQISRLVSMTELESALENLWGTKLVQALEQLRLDMREELQVRSYGSSPRRQDTYHWPSQPGSPTGHRPQVERKSDNNYETHPSEVMFTSGESRPPMTQTKGGNFSEPEVKLPWARTPSSRGRRRSDPRGFGAGNTGKMLSRIKTKGEFSDIVPSVELDRSPRAVHRPSVNTSDSEEVELRLPARAIRRAGSSVTSVASASVEEYESVSPQKSTSTGPNSIIPIGKRPSLLSQKSLRLALSSQSLVHPFCPAQPTGSAGSASGIVGHHDAPANGATAHAGLVTASPVASINTNSINTHSSSTNNNNNNSNNNHNNNATNPNSNTTSLAFGTLADPGGLDPESSGAVVKEEHSYNLATSITRVTPPSPSLADVPTAPANNNGNDGATDTTGGIAKSPDSKPSLGTQEKKETSKRSVDHPDEFDTRRMLGLARNFSSDRVGRLSAFLGNRSRMRFVASSSRIPCLAEFHAKATRFVVSPFFDYLVCTLIVVNAVFLGIQTDYMARAKVHSPPAMFEHLDTIFCIVFTAELLLRIWVFRMNYFTMPGWTWNVFDFIVVSTQVLEAILSEFWSAEIIPNGVGISRVLKLVRLIRIVRLARILRLIHELRVLVHCIADSVKSLAWTVLLLFILIYAVSLILTQLVLDHILNSESCQENCSAEQEVLSQYFGDIFRSMLSLLEAILGGVDWDILITPLSTEVSPWLGAIFALYVMFCLLAMLNVVTGVFVDSILTSARQDKDAFLLSNTKEIFQSIGCEEITLDTFISLLEEKHMLEFFRAIDVDPSEASNLFRLMDLDGSGSINAEEFFSGCIRLRGPARALDAAVLVLEVRRIMARMSRMEARLCQTEWLSE